MKNLLVFNEIILACANIEVMDFSRLILGIIAVLFVALPVFAEVQLGVSTPSVTHGRTIPALHVAHDSGRYLGTFYSTGVRTKAYYHSAWQVGLFNNLDSDVFLWGKVYPAVGWGVLYSKRGIKLSEDEPIQETSEFASGPALRVRWDVAKSLFLGVEAMLGLSWSSLALNFQHSSHLVLGVRL